MATKKRGAPMQEPSKQQAEEIARELVNSKSGLAGSEFKKELPADFKKFDKKILSAAESLASRGELYRWSIAKKVRFFLASPYDQLAQAIQEAFEKGPASEKELAQFAASKHRGTQDLVKEWLKGAVSRGEVFPYPPSAGSKTKRFWKEAKRPDAAELLKSVISALRKLLGSSAARHLDKEQALDVLAKELGVRAHSGEQAPASERKKFLDALNQYTREQPKGMLLSIRDLRQRAGLEKQRFDAIALALHREGIVTLHHHDHPESLVETDRTQLLVDARGTHYVGIALRSSL